jgi:hypothetical protein
MKYIITTILKRNSLYRRIAFAIKKIIGTRTKMTQNCSLCGTHLTPNDEEGICHICKMSIIFNEDIYPEIDDFAC